VVFVVVVCCCLLVVVVWCVLFGDAEYVVLGASTSKHARAEAAMSQALLFRTLKPKASKQ